MSTVTACPEVVRGDQMNWQSSPADGVVRKRLCHQGEAESGMVTSLVRYRPGSQFDRHYHPDGEEILVLEGVFSDEHGDYPAGSYLLNPDGSGHRPFSVPGCLLLVKLRQYPGEGREKVALDTMAMEWQSLDRPGLKRKGLYRQAGFTERISLLKFEPGCELGSFRHPKGAEIFVLEGSWSDEMGHYQAGTLVRLPAGTVHHPCSDNGCILYFKTG